MQNHSASVVSTASMTPSGERAAMRKPFATCRTL